VCSPTLLLEHKAIKIFVEVETKITRNVQLTDRRVTAIGTVAAVVLFVLVNKQFCLVSEVNCETLF